MTGENQGATVSVQWSPFGDAGVDIGSGVRLPSRAVVAMYDDPSLPLVRATVTVVDGVPVCDRLEITRRESGASLTGEELRRVPIAWLIEKACLHVALTAEEMPPDGTTVAWLPSHGDAHTRQVRGAVQKARGRRRITDSLLQDVARIYRANPDRPTAAVRDAYQCSAAQASRYVREARDRKILEDR